MATGLHTNDDAKYKFSKLTTQKRSGHGAVTGSLTLWDGRGHVVSILSPKLPN